MTARDEILAVVVDHLGECSIDELRVMCAVAKRLETGRARYGLLDLAADPRDWQRELAEELLDAVIYAAIVRLSAPRIEVTP